MARIVSLLLLLVVVLLGLSFAVLNAEPVQVQYYLGEARIPLSLAMVLSLIVGAILGVLATFGLVMRQRREIARLRRSGNDARKELEELRKLPLRESRAG